MRCVTIIGDSERKARIFEELYKFAEPSIFCHNFDLNVNTSDVRVQVQTTCHFLDDCQLPRKHAILETSRSSKTEVIMRIHKVRTLIHSLTHSLCTRLGELTATSPTSSAAC